MKADAEEAQRILLELEAEDMDKEIEDAAREIESEVRAELEESGGDEAGNDEADEASDDRALAIAQDSPDDMGSQEDDVEMSASGEDQDSKSPDGLSTGSAEGPEDATDLKVELERMRRKCETLQEANAKLCAENAKLKAENCNLHVSQTPRQLLQVTPAPTHPRLAGGGGGAEGCPETAHGNPGRGHTLAEGG